MAPAIRPQQVLTARRHHMRHQPDGLRSRRQKSARFALLAFGLAVLVAQSRGGAAPPPTFAADSLPYSRGILVTGNYVVGGVDVDSQNIDSNGIATGTIPFNDNPLIDNRVPDNSEIVAAFLYWEAVYVPGAQPTKGVKFRGHSIDPADETTDLTAWGTGPMANGQLVLTGPGGGTSPVPGLQWATIGTLPGNTAPCWGAANQTGTARLTMFKVDVLHMLPKLLDADNRWTGRRLVNDTDLAANVDETGAVYQPHTVSLPEGSGDQAIQSAGAALVVIYRNLSDPLTKIVMYDGAYTGLTMSQTLRGFYEHAQVNNSENVGRLAQLVGSGGNNSTERLYFNGTNQPALIATNPFQQTSPSSDRSWSYRMFKNLSMSGVTQSVPGYGEIATTTVNHQNANPNDCAAWGGIVFSTPVTDADQDGLPDALENSSTSGGVTWRNPNPEDVNAASANDATDDPELPDIHGMGAAKNRKDILVEINRMYTTGDKTYGSENAPYDSSADPIVESVTIGLHDHLPSPEALKMVGDAFYNAPITNIDNSTGIRIHFDIGPTLAAQYADDIDDLATLQGTPVPADKYIVTTGARGGEQILEDVCVGPPATGCQFPDFPGTAGWRLGLELYRNAPVKDNGDELLTPADVTAWENGTGASTTHRRRFDPLRASLVHYALYVHARGKPKSLPCLKNGVPTVYPDGVGPSCSPTPPDPFNVYAVNNAFVSLDYHVPTSSSGVADLPGGSLMISLGLWDKLFGVGTPYAQAATTFHELGHNLNLWHGAVPAILGQKKVAPDPGAPGTSTYVEPNCKPNQSTMNYMFQMHGLIDVFGNAHLDYSDRSLGYPFGNSLQAVDERNLDDLPFTNIPKYRPTWFAPASSTLAGTLGVDAATRLCNGVKFSELTAAPSPIMARVWASPSLVPDWNVAIDWHGDGVGTYPQTDSHKSNVNFDGEFLGTEIFSPSVAGGDDVLYGANDWANVRLDQIGAGSNVVLRRLEGGTELVSGDTLGGDTLGGDTLGGDTLGGDTLGGDTLGGDTLGGDTLGGDTLGGDTLGGDTLGGDTLGGDTLGGVEMQLQHARGEGRAETRALHACVLGGGCTGSFFDNEGVQHPQPGIFDPLYHKIYLTWNEPTYEQAVSYRFTLSGGGKPDDVRTIDAPRHPGGKVSWVVEDQLADHVDYTFLMEAELDDGAFSLGSATTIAGVNDWPQAFDDGPYTVGKDTLLTVPGPAGLGVLANDKDNDSPSLILITPPVPVSCPAYPALVSCPTPASAVAQFSFNPADGSFTFKSTTNFTGDVTFEYKLSNGNYSAGVPMNSTSNPPTDNVGKVTIRVVQRPRGR